MFIDYNRVPVETLLGKKFNLENSTHEFIVARTELEDCWIVDINGGYIYSSNEIANNEVNVHFYRDEDDEDYLGVWVEE